MKRLHIGEGAMSRLYCNKQWLKYKLLYFTSEYCVQYLQNFNDKYAEKINVQMGTRQAGHARRSRKFHPFSQQQINELFDEYYCYDLQHTELKLLHHIL